MLKSEPSDNNMFLHFATERTVAVGPFASVPRIGDWPSESGAPLGRPSGNDPVVIPKGVLDETVVVDA